MMTSLSLISEILDTRTALPRIASNEKSQPTVFHHRTMPLYLTLILSAPHIWGNNPEGMLEAAVRQEQQSYIIITIKKQR